MDSSDNERIGTPEIPGINGAPDTPGSYENGTTKNIPNPALELEEDDDEDIPIKRGSRKTDNEDANGLFDDDDDEEDGKFSNGKNVDRRPAGDSDDEDDIFGDKPTSGPETKDSPLYDSNRLDEDQEEVEQREMEISIPAHAISHNSTSVYTVRVPTFLSVEPRPFDADAFLQSVENSKNNKKSYLNKLKAENTLRWRYNKNEEGSVYKQSNAHFIKWSDGSLSMKLGNEIFDVVNKPIADTFLAISHDAQEILQSSTMVDKTMTFVPTSTSSSMHKKYTEALLKQQVKQASVRNIATNDDPDRIKREAEKAEVINLRARRKLENKRRLQDEKGGKGAAGSNNKYGSHSDRLGGYEDRYERPSSYSREKYDEEDDFVVGDDEEEEIDAMNSDDEDEEELERAERLRKVKRAGTDKYSDRNDHREQEKRVESDEDASRASRKKRRVISDDEDE